MEPKDVRNNILSIIIISRLIYTLMLKINKNYDVHQIVSELVIIFKILFGKNE